MVGVMEYIYKCCVCLGASLDEVHHHERVWVSRQDRTVMTGLFYCTTCHLSAVVLPSIKSFSNFSLLLQVVTEFTWHQFTPIVAKFRYDVMRLVLMHVHHLSVSCKIMSLLIWCNPMQ